MLTMRLEGGKGMWKIVFVRDLGHMMSWRKYENSRSRVWVGKNCCLYKKCALCTQWFSLTLSLVYEGQEKTRAWNLWIISSKVDIVRNEEVRSIICVREIFANQMELNVLKGFDKSFSEKII